MGVWVAPILCRRFGFEVSDLVIQLDDDSDRSTGESGAAPSRPLANFDDVRLKVR